VTKYIRNDAILQNEPEPELEPGHEAEDRVEDQGFLIPVNGILEALEMISFASICQIVKMIFINPTTIFRRLMKYR
jgi:hypothetical protein